VKNHTKTQIFDKINLTLKISLLFVFCLLGCTQLHAQKNVEQRKSPNFGCTFEDGPFPANIIAIQSEKPLKSFPFSTVVDIQGCQVIHISFDKIDKEFVAHFRPTDIDDSGNVLIRAERGLQYEIHLILP
jgi:hypothetical protein